MSDRQSNKNLIRIVLAAILLIIVVVKFFDMSARGKAKKVYDQVTQKLEANQTISDQEVHTMLGEPSVGFSPAERKWTEKYSYRGAFYRYSVLVKYSDQAIRLVEGVAMETE
jgi:hypothetical protein